MSIHAMTRKIVNYAWRGRSPRKLGWKPVAVVTCKSMVSVEHRGERPIELSSSWFRPKFLSGQLRPVVSAAKTQNTHTLERVLSGKAND